MARDIVRTRHALSLHNQLMQELSHFNMHYIADTIGDDEEMFAEIINILLNKKDPLPPRAAWVAEIVCQKYPDLIKPYLNKIVRGLKLYTHPGSRRNSLKILMRTEIPENLQGVLIDTCFEWLLSAEKTVAVKIFAMQIIENHLAFYPELAVELKEVIEDQWEKNSAGFKSRGRKVLKGLEKYL